MGCGLEGQSEQWGSAAVTANLDPGERLFSLCLLTFPMSQGFQVGCSQVFVAKDPGKAQGCTLISDKASSMCRRGNFYTLSLPFGHSEGVSVSS